MAPLTEFVTPRNGRISLHPRWFSRGPPRNRREGTRVRRTASQQHESRYGARFAKLRFAATLVSQNAGFECRAIQPEHGAAWQPDSRFSLPSRNGARQQKALRAAERDTHAVELRLSARGEERIGQGVQVFDDAGRKLVEERKQFLAHAHALVAAIAIRRIFRVRDVVPHQVEDNVTAAGA